jgi:hypothetical protein
VTLAPGGRHGEWQRPTPGLLACDVDGTTVGPDGTVSPRVVAALRAAVDAGMHVGLATGRMALGVTDVLEATGLRGPHVLHNGAEVRLDGDVVAAWPVPPAAVAALLRAAAATDTYVEVYVDGGYLVTRMDERARPHWDLLGHQPLGIVTTPDDLPGPVPKVTGIGFAPGEAETLARLLEDAGLLPGPAGSPATPALDYVNGTNPAADKGRALRAAAAHLGLPMTATVAVGDAANDLSMLAVAGTAVAMGQAGHDVRAAAHLVAPNVEDDGLAVVADAVVAGWAGVDGTT